MKLLPDGTQSSLHQLDYLDFLSQIEDESIDLIATDPPYASLEKHRKVGTTTRLKTWFDVIPNESFVLLFQEFYRVLKANTHAYVFADQETMFAIKPMGEAAGFRFWKPIVWNKETISTGYHYRAQSEFILFFEKGKRRLNSMSIPDVLSVRRLKGKDLYPTSKPTGLLEILIGQSSSEGEIILDPFLGSGACGEAAIKHRRRFLGNDLSPKAYEMACARLRAAGERAE